MISKAERNLLVRCARIIHTNAMGSLILAGDDPSRDVVTQQAKRDYDRFLKEERDLRAFIKRQPAKAEAPAGVVS